MAARSFLKRLMELIRPFWKAISTIASLLLLAQLVQAVSPYILGRLASAFLSKSSLSVYFQLGGLGFLAFAVKRCLTIVREIYEAKHFENALPQHLAVVTMNRIFAWSIAQHRRHHSGLIQAIIVEGEQGIQNAAHLIAQEGFQVVAQWVITSTLLLVANASLACILLGAAAMFSIVTYFLSMHVKEDMLAYEKQKQLVSKLYAEIHRNAPFVIVQAQEDREKAKCFESHSMLRNLGVKIWTWYNLRATWRDLGLGLGEYFFVIFGGYLILHLGYPAPLTVTCLFWARDLFVKIDSTGPIIRKTYKLWPSTVALLDLLSIQPELQQDSNPFRPPLIRGKIDVQHVTFWHNQEDGSDPTLMDVSFSVAPGEKIGIVGSSGAGKSTLINLLLRASDPSEGKILIDDVDLQRYDIQHYRRRIGFVEQHVPILDRTLRENILFGLTDPSTVTDQQLEEIVQLCRIDEFFESLPQGFDTMLGEQGVRLSGGQCQRVGIARALVKNPSILIFDEATSHLDSENEYHVHRAIEEASRGRTSINIAHRLSTVKGCDKILMITQGKVVGQDSHENLVQTCDEYNNLVQRQRLQ
jgi:ATP-binding cassette, subfamily B, bacterial